MTFLNGAVKVFSSKCPHLGISLVDGYFDKKKIVCPGHALTFNLKDGQSKCKNLKLKFYDVREKNKTLFLYT